MSGRGWRSLLSPSEGVGLLLVPFHQLRGRRNGRKLGHTGSTVYLVRGMRWRCCGARVPIEDGGGGSVVA